MRHRVGPRKTRHPGVYQTDDRFLLRWTQQVQGKRTDHEQLLPKGTTLEQAVARRATLIAHLKAPPAPPPPLPTVTAYVRSWLKRKAPRMKLSTAEVYAQVLGDHMLAARVDGRELGELRLNEVNRAVVDGWVAYAETVTRPVSRAPDAPQVLCARATVLGWWTKVRHVLRDAAADYDLPDPTRRVEGPRAYERDTVKEERTLTADELLALIDCIADGWHAELFTAASTGCRAGELYALTWPDVDLVGRSIRIKKSHYKGKVGATKTGKVRVVPIGEELLLVLRAHRARQMLEQHPALATGLVFPATEAGELHNAAGDVVGDRGWHRNASSALKHLQRASRAANLPILVTPQVLRRTFNTMLHDLGIPPLVIQAMVGHVSSRMTAHYHHASDSEKTAAIARLEDHRKG